MRVSVDTGGTFTDFVAHTSAGETHYLKQPSTPHDPAEAILLGLRCLENRTGEEATRLDHGTTVGTNAMLEGKTAKTLLIVNEGFEDILLLGRQNRAALFALEPDQRVVLLPRSQVLGIRGRIGPRGEEWLALEDPHRWIRDHDETLRRAEAVAVCLLHSCSRPSHEQRLAAALTHAFPALYLSCSHQIASLPREYERAQATVANALVQPVMDRYLGRLEAARPHLTIRVMASHGGLMEVGQARRFPVRTLLSGPAGGVVGAWTAAQGTGRTGVLSLDMGGTSTDVAAGQHQPVCTQEGRIGRHAIAQEMLPVETVGAGGGSIAWIDEDGLLQVGPHSAGADPGPAAYGRGGQEPTVTDANVVLGRLPSLLGGALPLDKEAAATAIAGLASSLHQSVQATAHAILLQAEARMARACRRVTLARGLDPQSLCMVAFGGAGPLHAAAVCDEIGCSEFLVPEGAGLLSAWGIAHARPKALRHQSWPISLCRISFAELELRFHRLKEAAETELLGPTKTTEHHLRLRYRGQGFHLRIPWHPSNCLEDIHRSMKTTHLEQFGFAGDPSEIEIVRLETEVFGPQRKLQPIASTIRSIEGPQLLEGMDRTVWLPEGWTAELFAGDRLRCRRRSPKPQESRLTARSLSLEVHHQRLASIAEEMGERLCRSARSTNIKERKDYSCAVFDADGAMLAHAAHIPVHLGATPATVRAVIDSGLLQKAHEVLVNDPYAGGSHLPDLCLVSAPRSDDGFLVANRAHHADVGGITPGSLPSSVTPAGYRFLTIEDEGIRLPPTVFDSEVIERVAEASRSPWERKGDLQAQKASNASGLAGLKRLHDDLGSERFRSLNQALLDLGAARMTRCIAAIPDGDYAFEDHLDDDGLGGGPLSLPVRITIDGGRATVDFRAAPDQVASPINASRAVTESAVLYVFCCLARHDMPANAGMLRPLQVLTRPGSLLDPLAPAPVSAGNVETSQRIVDCLMGALAQALPQRIPAASGGSMNNLLFGALDDRFVHYETLASGAGAGPSGKGADGIQTHMTNTLNTPIERLEQAFPVRVEGYSLAPAGPGNGGRGVCRSIRFMEPVMLSLSGERRSLAPWGLHGAPAGRRGRQSLTGVDGLERPLPAKISLEVGAGTILHLESPGGGAWQDWSKSSLLAMSTAPETSHD